MGKGKRVSDEMMSPKEEQPSPKKQKVVTFAEPNLKTEFSDDENTDKIKKTKTFAGNPKKRTDDKKSNTFPGKFKTKFDFKNKFKNNSRNDKFNKVKTEAPPNWAEYKKKKKELKLKRKQNNDLYDIGVRAKKLSEKLRIKTVCGGKDGKEDRIRLTEELHTLLGNQNNYVKFVFTHDMSRVVQQLLKFGSENIRREIAKELIPETVQILQLKYSKFCVERMLKYGNNETRSAVINACYGSVVKLASHVLSANAVANMYSKWASAVQKQHFRQEFYGDMYKQVKDNNVHRISDVYATCSDLQSATLGAVKGNLSRIFNKKLLDSQLIHAVLEEYLSEVKVEADRSEMIAQLASHAVILSNTREGAKVVMQCIWHGTNKDKKTIIKAFKEHIKDLACHEHAHTAFITILDAVDDTVLVNKVLVTELLNHASELISDEWGRKVLLWLVAPGDPHHFHPKFISELKAGLESSKSKKAVETRRKELLVHCIDPLLKQIADDTEKWMSNSSIAMVTLAILIADPSAKELKSALNHICTHICNPDWTIVETKGEETTRTSGIDHGGFHMILKKLALNDKVASSKDGCLFGAELINVLTNDTLKSWIKINRGCFLLIAVWESNSEEIVSELSKLLKGHVKSLKKESTAGAKILWKKLDKK